MKTIVGKVVLLGYQGVGKTSTVLRYVERTFNKYVTPTIGASFFTSKLIFNDITVKLQIWDTAGQERFKAMAPMFFRNANAAIVIFDITSYASFEHMQDWVTEVKRNTDSPVLIFVVGNKIDLGKERAVPREEAVTYANSIGAAYHECSAMEDQGVDLVFNDVAQGLIRVSGGAEAHNLRIYNDNGNIEDIMARSSSLEATDTGREEAVNLSINHIAHGDAVKSSCC